MSTAYQRGIVLFQQGRDDLADREFRQALAEDPDDPLAHAFLSLCLGKRDLDAEALREADEAVRTAPDLALSHFARGRALRDLDRHDEAMAAALEAIRLDPGDAGHYALVASIEFGRRLWADALDSADHGLSLDPEHAGCMNLRAMALVQLGRKEEAAAALGSALADDPENAVTHANQGWALLHRGDHVQALVHFREALRLDPELEWARAGIVEALKARHLIYRWMLGYFLWMGRQSQRAQWVVILAFVFGRRLLAKLALAAPSLEPIVIPILILSTAFLMMTWVSSPLFNLALRFNRFGRLALSREQRVESNWIGGCFIAAVVSFVAALVTGSAYGFILTGYFGLLILPLAMAFQQPRGTPRWLASAYTAVVAAAGAGAIVGMVLGPASPLVGVVEGQTLLMVFLFGAMFSTWIPAGLSALGLR